jgi:hypothetical protein
MIGDVATAFLPSQGFWLPILGQQDHTWQGCLEVGAVLKMMMRRILQRESIQQLVSADHRRLIAETREDLPDSALVSP